MECNQDYPTPQEKELIESLNPDQLVIEGLDGTKSPEFDLFFQRYEEYDEATEVAVEALAKHLEENTPREGGWL